MASESQGTLFQNGKPNINPKNLKPYQACNWLAAWPFTSQEEENEDDDDDNEAYLPAIALKKKLMNHKRWKSIRDSNAGKWSQENETKAGRKHHHISEPVEEEEKKRMNLSDSSAAAKA